MIHADKANINSNQKVKVAINDSGVDAISGIKVKERINLVDDKEDNLLFFEDYSGHGTSVAGIIAGSNGEKDPQGNHYRYARQNSKKHRSCLESVRTALRCQVS